jgi:hypothetical protein
MFMKLQDIVLEFSVVTKKTDLLYILNCDCHFSYPLEFLFSNKLFRPKAISPVTHSMFLSIVCADK